MEGCKKIVYIFWILVLLAIFSSCSKNNEKVEEKVVAIISSAENGDMIVAGNNDSGNYFLGIIVNTNDAGDYWELYVNSPVFGFVASNKTNSKALSSLIGADGFIYKVPKKNVNAKLDKMFSEI